jgi:hypothetical protein
MTEDQRIVGVTPGYLGIRKRYTQPKLPRTRARKIQIEWNPDGNTYSIVEGRFDHDGDPRLNSERCRRAKGKGVEIC